MSNKRARKNASNVIDLSRIDVDQLLAAGAIEDIINSVGDNPDKLLNLRVFAVNLIAKITNTLAASKVCGMTDCVGDGTVDCTHCACKEFRVCATCLEQMEDDDNQEETLEAEDCCNCSQCAQLLCSSCDTDECEYCNKKACRECLNKSKCGYQIYCADCEDDFECPDCDQC